jgi:hephaestin
VLNCHAVPQADLHSVFWQGQTVLHRGHRRQSIEMIAGSAYTVDMVPDLGGRFQFGCGIDEHFKGGMVGSFRVQSSVGAAAAALGGVMRSYYIAAVERQWNYAPTGTDTIAPMHGDGAVSALSMDAVEALADTTYKKVVYVEFTDATFTVEKAVPPEWAHEGIMGPVLRAEVGDTLVVTLRNDGPQPCSIRPHGLNHMAGEGFAFAGGYQAHRADVVQPGATHTYSFEVPERSGPGASDGSSVAWLYYSDVDHTVDINTGLVGGIVVTRKGSADAAGKPTDVDKEFFALFNVRTRAATFWSCARRGVNALELVRFGAGGVD